MAERTGTHFGREKAEKQESSSRFSAASSSGELVR